MPAPDDFNNYSPGLDAPATRGAAITPNDSADLAFATRAVYVGGAGNIAAILQGDTVAVTFTGVVAGSILPIRVARVLATGTTATALVGLR